MESRKVVEFPLTKKWKCFIRNLSYRNSIPFTDLIQEAMILEWQISTKILNDLHRENYFKKCLKRKIYGIKNDKWKRYTISMFYDFDNEVKSSDEFIDSLIDIRSFNKLYFNDLINHIVCILLEMDREACEIFKYRLDSGLKWKEIKNKKFKIYPHNKYYNKIKLIKRIVTQEIRSQGHISRATRLSSRGTKSCYKMCP